MSHDLAVPANMSGLAKGAGAADESGPDRAPPTERIGHQVRLHRRELMAAEFERVALDLFVERGYSNVSVEDISDAAGVSARTFYRYFAAKEDVLALYPQRLSGFVRQALADEPPDRPVFDAFASVLLKLAASMDLDELRRWCSVMISDRHSYSSIALQELDLRQVMEPLFVERFSEQVGDRMHLDLALKAGQSAITAATAAWYQRGGDLVSLLREALSVFQRGFSRL